MNSKSNFFDNLKQQAIKTRIAFVFMTVSPLLVYILPTQIESAVARLTFTLSTIVFFLYYQFSYSFIPAQKNPLLICINPDMPYVGSHTTDRLYIEQQIQGWAVYETKHAKQRITKVFLFLCRCIAIPVFISIALRSFLPVPEMLGITFYQTMLLTLLYRGFSYTLSNVSPASLELLITNNMILLVSNSETLASISIDKIDQVKIVEHLRPAISYRIHEYTHFLIVVVSQGQGFYLCATKNKLSAYEILEALKTHIRKETGKILL